MTETFGVFASTPVTTDLVLARWFRQFAPSGVVEAGEDAADRLQVSADGTAQLLVRPGMALAGGWWYRTDEDVSVPVTPNGSGSSRRDLVVVRADSVAEECRIHIIEGTPGSGTAPSPVRDVGGTWDVPLAEILIAGGSSVVTSGDVTNRREFTATAGAVRAQSSYRHTGLGTGGLQYETDTGRLILETSPGVYRVVDDPTYPTAWQNLVLHPQYTSGTSGHTPMARMLSATRVELRGTIRRINDNTLSNDTTLARVPSSAMYPNAYNRYVGASTRRSGGVSARMEVVSTNTTVHLPGQIRLWLPSSYDPTWVALDGWQYEVV